MNERDSSATLIRGGIVLPMEGGKPVLDPGSVLIEGDTIVAVGPVDEVDATRLPPARRSSTPPATPCIPGLHNCHLHSGLLRGTAESMSLWDWLEAYVDPAHKALTPEIAEAASLLCLHRERCAFGTTSVHGHVALHGGLGRGRRRSSASGPRSCPTSPTWRATTTSRRSRRTGALLETHRTRRRRPGAHLGRPRAPLLLLARVRSGAAADLAEEFDTGIHTHSSESIWEVQESLKRFGRRPIEEFYNRGILGERTVVAHCVWLDDREIELLAQTGTERRPLPVLEHEALVGPGPHRRHARGRASTSASAATARRRTTTST